MHHLDALFPGCLLLAAIIYGVSEFQRWKQPDVFREMTIGQKARRIGNYILLLIVLTMWLIGMFFPTHPHTKHLARVEFLYWLFVILAGLIIPLVAIRELNVTLKQNSLKKLAEERRAALDAAIATVTEVAHDEAAQIGEDAR